jgi:hypothetical protein
MHTDEHRWKRRGKVEIYIVEKILNQVVIYDSSERNMAINNQYDIRPIRQFNVNYG